MYLDEIFEGMELDIPPVTIKKEKMLAFARDYDPIPLHYDEEYAKGTRFGRVIAPGVMSFMSVWAEYCRMDIFGEELIAGMSTKIQWFKPVFADDILTGHGRVTKVTRRNDYNGICELTIDVTNQHGEMVLSDVTEALVKYRPKEVE